MSLLRRRKSQALTEFAFTLPLFLVFVFGIIQMSIVFIQYYSEAELALRMSRWLAINAKTTDAAFATKVQASLLPGQFGGTPTVASSVTNGIASSAQIGRMRVVFSPCIVVGPNCTGTERAPGNTLFVQTEYDVVDLIFLPTEYRIGFYSIRLPTTLPSYRVYKMVE